MSYNHFYNHGNTFQNVQFLPPPPAPPSYFIPPKPWTTHTDDANFVKQFECTIARNQKTKPKPPSISAVREEIRSLILKLKELKNKQTILTDKVNDLSDEEWSFNMKEIEAIKVTIHKILTNINNMNVEVLQKLITKRLAKRARLKRLRSDKKKEKEEWIKQMQEKSRQIDEKIQKVQDDIKKNKQDEESKIQADLILKETLRKRNDAKKYQVKLDALMKLRRARQNTAKGRGENVSETESNTFNDNIEKLKALWNQRLSIYSKEESDLRAKLAADPKTSSSTDSEREVATHLAQWNEALFGGMMPQADFNGDVGKFIATRSEWDMFLSSEGSSIPIGWVPPS